MATNHPAQPLSYEDYAAIDDDRRYQVLEGELIVSPSPSTRHQRLLQRLNRALDGHVQATGAGEVFFAPYDVVLRAERPATVLQPDIVFVSTARAAIVTKANVQGPPDLVVEVLSPANARLDTVRKLNLFARFGVPEYWIVGHEFDRIDVFRLGPEGRYARATPLEAGDTLTTPQLPGFALSLTALFADLD